MQVPADNRPGEDFATNCGASPKRAILFSMTTTQPKRRFFRYSLRTLMLLVTVFCIWMGIVTKRARDQKYAVEAIRELGGVVFYEHQTIPFVFVGIGRSPPGFNIVEPGPKWLRRFIGDEYFFTVSGVNLGELKIDDASLAEIKRLTNVKTLDLRNTQVTDIGLKHLKGWTDLTSLNLRDTNITDAGLEHLKGLAKLLELQLNNKVSDESVKKLQQALPNCKIYNWNP